MVTLAVLGILLVVGVPSFTIVLLNSRTAALTNDLTSAINLARAEAVTRAEPVTVCPSDDATTCSGSWSDGWIVLVPSLSSPDDVLRRYPAPAEGSSITQTPTADAALEFGALGEQLSAPTQLLAQVDGCRGERARRLDVAPGGRVSVSRVACT